MELFPLGVEHYILGGLLVGFGVAWIYFWTGIVAGASGFFGATLSLFTTRGDLKKYANSRSWRIAFGLGIVSGAFLFSILTGSFFVTKVQLWRLFFGGLLVGFGVRISRGCTSGHGICGLSSLSFPSLVAVLTFMSVAILTAFLISNLGVLP
ncbi:YeeE/YedE family protein [Candidatus Woesearchaeota archaeon]|nr:MAG: YeeE/YedE family protein [Candidatus Woesearchaeota archaeon]